MRYVVTVGGYPDVSLEAPDECGVEMRMGDYLVVFGADEFQEFRRAVGYAWDDLGRNR